MRQLLPLLVVVCCGIAMLTGFIPQVASADDSATALATQLGKCSWWNHTKQEVKSKGDALDMFRIGFANGFAIGILGPVVYFNLQNPPLATTVPPVVTVPFWRGYAQILRRPAILEDAFNAKCSDYRNEGLELGFLGVVIALELGGLESARVDAALSALRGIVLKSGADSFESVHAKLLDALTKPTPQERR